MQAPIPHHADQAVAFQSFVDTTFGPLAINVVTKIDRLPRQRCSVCHLRRICFSINFGGVLFSPPVCARDAGIR